MFRSWLPQTRDSKTDHRSVFAFLLLVTACATQPPPADRGGVLGPSSGHDSKDTPTPAPAKRTGAGLDELAATKRFCLTGPEAAVARGKLLLGDAMVAQADVLPNPTLSVEHNRSFTGEQDHETVIGIGVPLGIGGRRWILQDAAAARRAQTELEAASGRVIAAVSFRRTFVSASLSQARVGLYEQRQKVYEGLVEKLDKLEGGGENAQLDRDRLQVQAEISGAGALRDKRELLARRAWLEAIVGASISLTSDLEQLAGSAGDAPGDNPKVAALEKSAEASAIEADAARRRWVPDVTLFGGYRHSGGKGIDGGNGVSLGLSVPLTFFDHGQGEAQRAQANASIAQARVEKQRRLIRATESEVTARLAVIAEATPQLQKALQLAKKTEQGTQRLFLAGETKLLDVVQATQSRTALELALIDLAAARADALLARMGARGRFDEPALDEACLRGKK